MIDSNIGELMGEGPAEDFPIHPMPFMRWVIPVSFWNPLLYYSVSDMHARPSDVQRDGKQPHERYQ